MLKESFSLKDCIPLSWPSRHATPSGVDLNAELVQLRHQHSEEPDVIVNYGDYNNHPPPTESFGLHTIIPTRGGVEDVCEAVHTLAHSRGDAVLLPNFVYLLTI